MKTIHVLSPGPTGGAETVVLNLVRGLGASGNPAAIAAIINEQDHPYVAAARASGIEVIEIREGGRQYHRQASAIARAAKEVGARLIHTHGYLADVIGNWAGKKANLPVVSTLHGFTVAGRRAYLYDIPLRWAHRHASAVVAVSPPIVARLQSRGVKAERIQLIPNAWYKSGSVLDRREARRALGVADDGRRVGWVGRLSPEKGADVFIDSVARLTDPSVGVSIVGDGNERAALELRAAAAGVTEQVRWHGLVPSAERFLRAFDALVLSSRTEGTPMVLLEAMAAGVPIVSTAVGGVPHMLSDSEALLVESERPDLLAAAIAASLGDASLASARAAAALARVQRDFNAEPWINRHVSLYRDLAGV